MGDRTVSIGGNATGNSIVTGDHNAMSTQFHGALPSPDQVDISAEIAALRERLAGLQAPDQGKLLRALADAEEEAAKPDPAPDEIGAAMDRAIGYAKKANGFADQAAKLLPHLKAVCGWLGDNWHRLLVTAGFGSS